MSFTNTNTPHSHIQLLGEIEYWVAIFRRSHSGRQRRDGADDDDEPDDRAELAEQHAGDRHPELEEAVRVPQRDAWEQDVHQPALHLPLLLLLVAAEQDGRVGRDVGVDQVGRVQVAEDLDDLGLRRRVVGELPAGQVPRLGHRARAVEQPDEAVGRVAQAVELVARGVADDVPPLAAVVLPRDLRAGAQLGPQVGHAVPGLGECRA
jgi:hypothetical protein